MAEGFITVTS